MAHLSDIGYSVPVAVQAPGVLAFPLQNNFDVQEYENWVTDFTNVTYTAQIPYNVQNPDPTQPPLVQYYPFSYTIPQKTVRYDLQIKPVDYSGIPVERQYGITTTMLGVPKMIDYAGAFQP